MQEKLKTNILTGLSTNFTTEQLRLIESVLIVNLVNFEVAERITDVAIYQDGLPMEIKSFLVCKSIKGLTESSLVHYKRTLENFAYSISKDIKEVSANDIRMYLISYEKSRQVSKSTLDDKRRVFNSFYSWMMKEDIIDKNPMLKIDAIKCDKKIREPLTMMELEKLRNSCETPREKALVEILYSSGARISELIALNKKDIDFQTERVKVFGKGKKERYCFINAKAQLALKKYMYSRTDDSEALFVAGKKPYNRLGKGTIEKEIKNLGIRANINREIFPHLLRHTNATHSINNGASLAEVQMLLGHESPTTTQIYAKLDLQNLQAVHRRCVI